MRLRYYQKGKDMTQADYTTGTITTATNGDETIVGDSTVWTAGMAGNWMRITAGAAASLGDGQWYEIDSITDNTNLELVKTYGGTSISSASANYTIGEMPLIPGAFHDIILWRALAIYYDQNPDAGESSKYWMRYDGGYEAGLSPRMGGMLKRMFETEAGTGAAAYMPPYGASHKELDPNLFPRDLTAEDWP